MRPTRTDIAVVNPAAGDQISRVPAAGAPGRFAAGEPKNGSSSPSTAAGPHVYAAAGWIAQSPIGRSAEQLRGTMRLGLPRYAGVPNRRV